MFAQIAAGIGRDPALHAGELKDDPLGRGDGGMGAGDFLYPSTSATGEAAHPTHARPAWPVGGEVHGWRGTVACACRCARPTHALMHPPSHPHTPRAHACCCCRWYAVVVPVRRLLR
jgi:hypothetical protein